MSEHVWVVELKDGKTVEVTAAQMERDRESLRFYDSDDVLGPLVAIYANGGWLSCHKKGVTNVVN